MCGLAGYSGDFDEALLRRMNTALAHRGPDDAGTWSSPEARVGLAHRRLSIIDLSPRGHQPMWDATGRATIVFNGEIYNYRELRAALVAKGHVFHSDSDTEVLLNLYLAHGEGMLPLLNGIFAFAIWDVASRSLLVARDGLGVKPLYYTQVPKGILFASELKALLHEPTVPRTLDPEAVHQHLLYLWCPAPRTLLESVKKLEPGHAMVLRDGKLRRQFQFYELPYDQPIAPLSEMDAISAVRETLRTAVDRQMVADVPVGAFLSGGLDSSSVVAMARGSARDGRLQCFSIGFRDEVARREGMALDLPYAERVAQHLGVDLNVIWVGPEMVDELPRMIFQLDEPQADPAPINSLFICRMAREQGIKVLLSGAGGDDIFTGYRRHFALTQESRWSWLPRPARSALRAGSALLPTSSESLRRVVKAFSYADRDGDARIASYFYWIDPDRLARLHGPALRGRVRTDAQSDPLVRALAALPADAPPLHRMLFLDSKFFLADHNLNYTDKTSMASGVEVRVPLLDPDLVALAARLPLELLQRGRTGKWILKRAMEPDLPHDVIYRPKTGFGAPLRSWLRGPLAERVDELALGGALERRGLFDRAAVRALIDDDRAGRIDAAYTVFGLLCLELWCRMFVDPPVPTLV